MLKQSLKNLNRLVCDSRFLDAIEALCSNCNLSLTIERSKSIDVFNNYTDCLTIQFNDFERDYINIYSYDQNSISEEKKR